MTDFLTDIGNTDALDNWTPATRAVKLLQKHGHAARINGDYLEGNSEGGADDWEEIARIDAHGDILKGHALAWLGY